jgi:CO/xanthine dehydrogenase Mo-binding subunit
MNVLEELEPAEREAQVERSTGVVRVKRLVVAHDCGLIINPDGVKNQIEGNMLQCSSPCARRSRRRCGSTSGTSPAWTGDVPDPDVFRSTGGGRPDQPALGAGEPATVTTVAAVANAVFDATGVRLRQMPFTPERVRGALLQQAGTGLQ